MRSAIVATGFGIVAMLMAVAVPQISLAQPGAEFQDQGLRESLGYPALGGPHRVPRVYAGPPAYGYVFVPERVLVHHPKFTPHRRHH
jgi:hypothetical protein